MKFWIDKGGFIYLFQILKAAGAIHDYKDVSLAIKHGQVMVNDETCFKQRQVLKLADTVRYKRLHIKIVERDELGRTDEEAMRSNQPQGNVKHGKMKEWDYRPLQKEMDIEQDLEEVSRKLHENLLKSRRKLAVAESCTGGMLQSLITSHAGASNYFVGGVVSYSNDVKMNLLKVDKKTLENFGAVSKETAIEMVIGTAEKFGAKITGSITGIAGPSGGTAEKPVGTIYIATSINKEVSHQSFQFRGDRDMIRKKSCLALFKMLLEKI